MSEKTEIILGNYRFYGFEMKGSDVSFYVRSIFDNLLEETDSEKIITVLSEMGGWESMATGILYLLEEAKLTDKKSIQVYEKPTGSNLYNVKTGIEDEYMHVIFHLIADERHRREKLKQPLLSIDEIYNQIGNIPKWLALKKSLKMFKEL